MRAHRWRALTLWPEWAWAIHALDKRVENRHWRIPRGWVAIHAGAYLGGRPSAPAVLEAMRALGLMSWRAGWRLDAGAHFVKEGREVDVPLLAAWPRSAILGIAHFDGAIERGGWAAPGALANHLDEYLPLDTPLPCRGAQGLWPVPVEYAPTLRELHRLLGWAPLDER